VPQRIGPVFERIFQMTQISRNRPVLCALLLSAAAIVPGFAEQAPPAVVRPAEVKTPEVRVERRIVIVDENGVQSELGPEVIDDPQVQNEIRRLRGAGPPDGRVQGPVGEGPRRIMMIRRGDGPGVGGDRGKGRGGPAARMQRMADELGLSPAQRKQVRDIYEGVRPQMDATRSQMRIERQRLRDASPGSRDHAATVAAASKRIGDLSAQAAQQRGELERKVWQVLTPEQRAKADAQRAESRKRRDEQADRLERRARELRGQGSR
jgi:Spy/CpxP family protein refolding chaperone